MITAQVESFRAAMPEIQKLVQTHWHELALFQHNVPLDPQYDEYCRREDNGNLFLTTVRRDGAIVAYYIAQVAPGFHYRQTLTATMDIVYVMPQYRNKGLIVPLMRCVEAELRRRGAQVWYMGYKTHTPLGMPRLLEAYGFIPADTYMAKWIGA